MAQPTTPRTSWNGWRCTILAVTFVLLQLVRPGAGDYENTWNFYYEQPCCGSGQSNVAGIGFNGQHHLRHHRVCGGLQILFLEFVYTNAPGPVRCLMFRSDFITPRSLDDEE
uniref:Secreted protein n=1 Tax=Anopheles maculatus TaxID=74869 RepID=A0A182T0C1_9DIPT